MRIALSVEPVKEEIRRSPSGLSCLNLMNSLFNPEFLTRWLKVVLIDLTLAGDNALVIAMAVRGLSAKQQFWGRMWGTGGAVGLRLCFVFLVTWLLKVPALQLVGGCMLLWIAFKLVRQEAEETSQAGGAKTILEAVRLVIVADMVMSLDNVLAIAAAARGDIWLVVFGLMLSLPLVIWGSGLLAALMNRFSWIVWLGGAVLGHLSGDLFFKDPMFLSWVGPRVAVWHEWVAWGLAAVVGITGWRSACAAKSANEGLGQTESGSSDPVVCPERER